MLGWVALGTAVALISIGFLYWLLVLTEGTYLGQGVVTWLYDITAHRYDDIKGFHEDMEAMFLGSPLAAALRPEPSPLVLDIGTGTGRLPLILFDQPTFQGRIVGVDHSRQMLRLAAQKLALHADRLWLIWRDGMQLPFPDAVFDAVTCLEMLEFTPDPAALLAEAIRVLRPGGLLLTTRRAGTDARFMPGKVYSVEQMETLLHRLGIENARIQPWQVDYDLVWGLRDGESSRGPRHPLEALRCPACGAQGMAEGEAGVVCVRCNSLYRVRHGIIEMVH